MHTSLIRFSLHFALAIVAFWGSGCLANSADPVNLSLAEQSDDTQVTAIRSDRHVLSNPWWQNFDISGFGAVGFYDTGEDGTRPHGGFEIKEASLFIHADVWEDMELFFEVQTNRLGKDDQLFTRTGEIYLHFRDVIESDSIQVGIKTGRIDIPFGEEYLWQDAIDNRLVTNSASYVYGWDEGVLVYGRYKEISFVASITDGTDERSSEDHDDKALNLKVYGNPTDDFYLSASAMHNGVAAKSAVEFGGSHFQPVGDSHVSSLGISSSSEVSGNLYQIDATYQFSENVSLSAHIGLAHQEDDDTSFDRDFRWFGVEPYVRLNNRWYLSARYSEIGTYDDEEGYHFDGKTFANGNGNFGYDTERFRRVGLAVGYEPNPRVRLKMELGKDWFDLIDASTIAEKDDRDFLGIEVAVRI